MTAYVIQNSSSAALFAAGRHTWVNASVDDEFDHAIHFARWEDADRYRVRELGNQPHNIVPVVFK